MDTAHRNSLQPGHLVHWYKIDKILGQGGFGITYLATDTNLNTKIAIKEYLPIELAVREANYSLHPISNDHSHQYSWGLERFIAEAQTLAKFDHHNIVRVLTVFEENNTAYMLMRYEEGESLHNILKARKTLDEKTLKNILFPIMGGLEKIHAEGFIHRDIKPANIYIRSNGSPVLLDFGAARQSLNEETKTLTSMVSSGYAPFEQYFSKSDQQGPWTDIYGLGATMYRAITSKTPIDAIDRSNTILQLSKDTLVSVSEIGHENYSETFLKAIDHSLQFKYQDRPQTIFDWKKEFKLKKHASTKQTETKIIQEKIPTRNAESQDGVSIKKEKKGTSKLIKTAATLTIFITLITLLYIYGDFGVLLNKEQIDEKILTAQEELEMRRGELRLLEEKAEQERIRAEELVQLEEERKRKLAEEQARKKKEAEEKQKQINTLLVEAKDDIRVKRLVYPKNNNAYEKYRKILELSLEHAEAKEGIAKIGSIFISEAQLAADNKNFSRASKLLTEAEKIIPGTEKLKKARQSLIEAKKQAELEEEKHISAEKMRKLEEEKQQKIKELLTQADADIKAKRLIEPENNNALANYRKVLELSPDHPDATQGIISVANSLVAESKILIGKNDFTSAAKILNEANKITPDSEEVKTAQNLLITAKLEAKKEKERIAEESKIAAEKIKKKEEKRQLQIKTLLAQADAYTKAKRLIGPKGSNALANYRKVLELSPDHPDATQGIISVANSLVAESKILIGKNDFTSAARRLDVANKITPNSEEVKTAQNLLITAKLEAKKAKIRDLVAQINKGIENRDFEIAKKLLTEAKTLDPDSKELQSAFKDYEVAYSSWQKEQSLAKEVKQLLASAQKNLEAKRLTTPKGNNALEQFQKVLEIESNNIQANEGVRNVFDRYLELAQEAGKTESYQKAKTYINKANEIIPDDPSVIAFIEKLKPKIAELKDRKKEEETKKREEQERLEKEEKEKRLAEERQKAEVEEAKKIELQRLADEKQRTEAEAAKQLELKRLADEEIAKQAKNTKAGEFVKIPGGTYIISGKSVTIEPFEMGKYEITQGQWKAVMGNNPSENKTCGDKCAVENIKWDQVQEFIKKINSGSGIQYRLPTVAEWEYACAMEKSMDQCNGSNIHALFLGIGNRQGKRQPVGDKQPGVSNLTNNIWEWTCSIHKNKPSASDSVCDSTDKYATHAIRGGSKVPMDTNFSTVVTTWNNYALYYPNIGFRLVISK